MNLFIYEFWLVMIESNKKKNDKYNKVKEIKL